MIMFQTQEINLNPYLHAYTRVQYYDTCCHLTNLPMPTIAHNHPPLLLVCNTKECSTTFLDIIHQPPPCRHGHQCPLPLRHVLPSPTSTWTNPLWYKIVDGSGVEGNTTDRRSLTLTLPNQNKTNFWVSIVKWLFSVWFSLIGAFPCGYVLFSWKAFGVKIWSFRGHSPLLLRGSPGTQSNWRFHTKLFDSKSLIFVLGIALVEG